VINNAISVTVQCLKIVPLQLPMDIFLCWSKCAHLRLKNPTCSRSL